MKGGLHRFLVDGQVVDGEEFGLVVDHFLSAATSDIVEVGEFDRVDGTCFFAHAAEDAAEFVDFKLRGVFFSVVPRGFRGFDMDAVCRTDGWAHHARNAFDATCSVFVESVDPTEVALLDAALFDLKVFAAFFGVLHRVAGASLTE